MNFQKDTRWDMWGINSIEEYHKPISTIELDTSVHKDVAKRFEVINKLILHSYYEYDFLDVAVEYALVTFEMALRIRYRELMGKEYKKENAFGDLINWAVNKGLLEDKKDVIDGIRKLRNDRLHPESCQQFGYLFLHLALRFAEIINGLYEDTDLRISRKKVEREVNRKLRDFVSEGAILHLKDRGLIIFEAILLLYNNRVEPPIYHFLFYPIFDPRLKGDRIGVGDPIVVHCKEFSNKDGSYSFLYPISGEEVMLSRISKKENVLKFQKWEREYKKNGPAVEQHIKMRIGEARNRVRRMDFE